MYACVLSFQDRSRKYINPILYNRTLTRHEMKIAIYSHLNHASLVVQGIVCLLFVISALISLYSFTLVTTYLSQATIFHNAKLHHFLLEYAQATTKISSIHVVLCYSVLDCIFRKYDYIWYTEKSV